MNELALFAGAGGGILGGRMLGWRTVCAVEHDAYAASVLVARQNDGCLPTFPIWDDVRTFDGRPWRGRVDVVSGGFPCQDISSAGKGAGIDGERSGLWREFARILGEVRPRFAFVENSPMLTCRGLGTVLGDLATLGYDARWGVLGAHHVGAPHKRDRIWIVADANCGVCQRGADQPQRKPQGRTAAIGRGEAMANGQRELQPQGGECEEWRRPGDSNQVVSDANGHRFKAKQPPVTSSPENEAAECGGWWRTEPGVGRTFDGMAGELDLHLPHEPRTVLSMANGGMQ